MANRQKIIRNNAYEKQKIYDKMRKDFADSKNTSKADDYEKHQRVLWNINSHYHGNKAKFGPKWVGPYEITDIFNDGANYEITLIPMKGTNIDNPMNYIKIPKKGNMLQPKAPQNSASTNANNPGRMPSPNIDTPPDDNDTNTNNPDVKTAPTNIIIPPRFNVPRSQLKPYFDDWEITLEAMSDKRTTLSTNILKYNLQSANVSPTQRTTNAIHYNFNANKLLINNLSNSPFSTYNNITNSSRIKLPKQYAINHNSYSLFGSESLPKIRANSVQHLPCTTNMMMYMKAINNTFDKTIATNNRLNNSFRTEGGSGTNSNSNANKFLYLYTNNELTTEYNTNPYIQSKIKHMLLTMDPTKNDVPHNQPPCGRVFNKFKYRYNKRYQPNLNRVTSFTSSLRSTKNDVAHNQPTCARIIAINPIISSLTTTSLNAFNRMNEINMPNILNSDASGIQFNTAIDLIRLKNKLKHQSGIYNPTSDTSSNTNNTTSNMSLVTNSFSSPFSSPSSPSIMSIDSITSINSDTSRDTVPSEFKLLRKNNKPNDEFHSEPLAMNTIYKYHEK